MVPAREDANPKGGRAVFMSGEDIFDDALRSLARGRSHRHILVGGVVLHSLPISTGNISQGSKLIEPKVLTEEF